MSKRILVIRAGQLGDTAYASSIIEPLRNHFGTDTIIDWVAKKGIANLFLEDPRLTTIHQIKSRNLPLIFNIPKLKVILFSWFHPYDLIVNLELGTIFNDVMRLSRAEKKVGMPYAFFAEPPETHAVENLKLIYKSFLDATDLEFAYPSLIGTNPAEVKKIFSLPEDFYVLVPANSHQSKVSSINHRAWPIQHWQELINEMAKRGMNIVIIGGAVDKQYLEQIKLPKQNVISLVAKTSFPQLIGLIQGARAVITTDTGPSHIAAAVNTPVYALIGPTNFKRTGPYKTRLNIVNIISRNLECSPCYHTERLLACKDNRCMSEITPDDVIDSITEKH